MLSFMVFMFLGFLCIVAVLVYLLYTQEKICRTLQNEHAEIRLLLRALQTSQQGGERGGDQISDSADSLLKLDFSKHSDPQETPQTANRESPAPELELRMDKDPNFPRP